MKSFSQPDLVEKGFVFFPHHSIQSENQIFIAAEKPTIGSPFYFTLSIDPDRPGITDLLASQSRNSRYFESPNPSNRPTALGKEVKRGIRVGFHPYTACPISSGSDE